MILKYLRFLENFLKNHTKNSNANKNNFHSNLIGIEKSNATENYFIRLLKKSTYTKNTFH